MGDGVERQPHPDHRVAGNDEAEAGPGGQGSHRSQTQSGLHAESDPHQGRRSQAHVGQGRDATTEREAGGHPHQGHHGEDQHDRTVIGWESAPGGALIQP